MDSAGSESLFKGLTPCGASNSRGTRAAGVNRARVLLGYEVGEGSDSRASPVGVQGARASLPATAAEGRRALGLVVSWAAKAERRGGEEDWAGLLREMRRGRNRPQGVLGRNPRVSVEGKTIAFPFYFHPFAQAI